MHLYVYTIAVEAKWQKPSLKNWQKILLMPFSAGTETKPKINQDAVRIIKDIYNVDMNETQHSKLIDDLPEIDIVITMGCNVECPLLTKHPP